MSIIILRITHSVRVCFSACNCMISGRHVFTSRSSFLKFMLTSFRVAQSILRFWPASSIFLNNMPWLFCSLCVSINNSIIAVMYDCCKSYGFISFGEIPELSCNCLSTISFCSLSNSEMISWALIRERSWAISYM